MDSVIHADSGIEITIQDAPINNVFTFCER